MPAKRNHEGYQDPTASEAIERYKRQVAGFRSRAAGEFFEKQIEGSLHWHFDRGLMRADKTPEPMRPISKANNRGQFLAHYEKKAQVDFCGTMLGGRAVRFEAKQTDTDRFERKRLTDQQMKDLEDHQRLGALCFVLLCFGHDQFYRVPWKTWRNMKVIYGRQYVTEKDVQQFRIPFTSGVLKILHGILDVNNLPLPLNQYDLCPICGEYCIEGPKICSSCREKGEKR